MYDILYDLYQTLYIIYYILYNIFYISYLITNCFKMVGSTRGSRSLEHRSGTLEAPDRPRIDPGSDLGRSWSARSRPDRLWRANLMAKMSHGDRSGPKMSPSGFSGTKTGGESVASTCSAQVAFRWCFRCWFRRLFALLCRVCFLASIAGTLVFVG